MKKNKLKLLEYGKVLLYFLVFFTSMTSIGQNGIKGTVSDQNGPLPGANIIVKGTSNGTQSDFDGNYSLKNVANTDVLVVSFLGYKSKEVDVSSQTTINIILEEDNESLDEVVVVGYGTQRKADLTGSVSTIKGTSFVKAATPNLASSLAGKVTGVTAMSRSGSPGGEDVDFFIRGKSTFSDSNNSPLVLVDGIERGMNRINPNDIASVTILKDAASAAIYGVKGANGVILITTKRAREGVAEVNYSTSFGTQTPLFLPDRMNAYQYATHLNEAIKNTADISGSDYVPEFTDEQLAAFLDGSEPSTDWWEESLKKSAPIQTHAITISNGTKNVRYLTSLEYLNQDGLYDLSSYKRYNLRVNIDGDISKNLSMSLNIAGRSDKRSESANENFQLISTSYPTFAPYVYIDGKQELHWNGLNASPIGYMNNSGYERNQNSSFQSTLSFKYKVPFVEGLIAKYAYSFDRDFLKKKTFETPYTFYTGTDPVLDKKQSIASAELTQRMTERTRKTGQFILDYQKTFGKHSLGGLFVFEHSDYYNEWIEGFRDGFISESIDQLFAGSTARVSNDGSANENARLGYAMRINYNYDNKYLLQLNTRYDKSFNFPKDNAGGWFPALSAGWRISNEDFMSDIEWLSNLKLRAGWGVYGNDRINPYQYLSLFEFSETRNNPSGTITGTGYLQAISPDVIPNPVVTWEKAKIYNFGLDYGILNGKITGDLELFKKRTEGLLISRADIPLEVGATLAPFNSGIVENKGLEASLRYKNNFGDLNMSLQGTFTYATSKIIEMSESANIPDGLKQTGRSFDSRYGYVSLGLFKNADDVANSPDQSFFGDYQSGDIKYKDISGPDGIPDGLIDGNDRTFIGRGGMPEVVFGLNTFFAYKGFELSADFQGGSRYIHSYKPSPFVNDGNGIVAFTNAWTEDNTISWLPRNYQGNSGNNDPNSDYWLTDGWFVKLRNAEFAYNVPDLPALQHLGIDALRLSVTGSNLFSITNIDYWDPEASDLGTHPYYYMPMRTISFAVNVTF
ncbi:TonB-dependent receptor [Postechiella marina]|uniref:TonB-dependent receptor n=1 Tax=Postechiella marina TaxID=943941 RepID=A0ABP8C353_9FLAO